MAVQFAVLASGSRGNSTLIRTPGAGLLIDVGLGPKVLAARLDGVGCRWEEIAVVVLTHAHSDHVDSATLNLLARHKVVFYSHEGQRPKLVGLPGFLALEASGLARHYDDRPFLTPSGARVEPLELLHDGATFGFRVEVRAARRERPVNLGYVADTGNWSETMADAMTDVDLLGVEFNHDVELQRRSRRSHALIARNLGDRGHLSNEQGADLVSAVLRRSAKSAVRQVVLLHLSQECNTPQIALSVAKEAARNHGRRIAIHAALQNQPYPNLLVKPSARSSRRAMTTAAFSAPGLNLLPF